LYKLVIFDFDGTIVDSLPGIIDRIRSIAQEYHLPAALLQEWIEMVGIPLRFQLEKIFPEQDNSFRDQVKERYLAVYDANLLDTTPLFPDALQTLNTLRSAGVKMAIVSTKRSIQIKRVIEHLNLRDYFDLIVGAQEVQNCKPDPEGTLICLEKLSVKEKESVVVGDSTYDIEMAQNAGVDAIGVSTGYHTPAVLSRCNPTFIVDRLSAILPIVMSCEAASPEFEARLLSGDLKSC
jgi:HAD superfamily hydrolase (TIGR01509 family)